PGRRSAWLPRWTASRSAARRPPGAAGRRRPRPPPWETTRVAGRARTRRRHSGPPGPNSRRGRTGPAAGGRPAARPGAWGEAWGPIVAPARRSVLGQAQLLDQRLLRREGLLRELGVLRRPHVDGHHVVLGEGL